MEANDQDLRRSLLGAPPSLKTSYVNSAMHQNYPHSNPFIHNHPSQQCTPSQSQNHHFDNCITQNHDGFLSPLNQSYSTASRRINPISVETSSTLGLGVEDHVFSMERLSLSLSNPNCSKLNFSPLAGHQYHDNLQRTINSRISNNEIRLGCHGHRGLNDQQFFLPPQHHNEDVRGHVVSVAKYQPGLIHRLENEEKLKLIEMILWEVKDNLYELMMDENCNHFIQSVFGASSVDQKTRILALVVRDQHKLTEVCIHNHGTRVIQKLLKYLKTPKQKSTVILALEQITARLAKSINGGYVIQQCLKLFSPTLTKFILDEVAKHCVEIATDKIGCSIIQKCLDQAKGEALKRLIEEIVSHALVLAEHRYGNYVVQYVVKMKIPQVNAAIISQQLLGKYDQLSMNKHASNVVEDLLEFSKESDAAIIVQEIMFNRNFLEILQNPYGNYVAQSALKNTKGALNKMFSNSILSNYAHLHNHLYGKRVLAFVKGCKIRV